MDGMLAYMVYRKTTNTDLYVHVDSEHLLAQKRTVLSILIHGARTICDKVSLQGEILHLQQTLKNNGYSW